MLSFAYKLIELALGGVFRLRKSNAPGLMKVRVRGKKGAILLLHGYTGASDSTWRSMIGGILGDEALSGWDVLSLGYSTSLRFDIPNVWSADPDLTTLSIALSTAIGLPPLSQYGAIAIVAHSMGGLIAQRCICDNADIRDRLSHLFLYAVPSNGLVKAGYFRRLKRQLSDMRFGSPFITRLRADWDMRIGPNPTFVLRSIAGDRDEFVGGASSLQPFAFEFQRVVPGNHSTVIAPMRPDDQCLTILTDGLSGRLDEQTAVDGAEVAVELRRFHDAVGALWDTRDVLDENARVTLSLALEGVGRRQDAIDVLKIGGARGSDVVGTLAGRLKRRWLAERVEKDFQDARELYQSGLSIADGAGDWSQVYYHAINICFLDLMATPDASEIPPSVGEMARRALDACSRAPDSVWRRATVAEANLYLGDLHSAIAAYRAALELATPREVLSFISQARRVSSRVFGVRGISKLEAELEGAGRSFAQK